MEDLSPCAPRTCHAQDGAAAMSKAEPILSKAESVMSITEVVSQPHVPYRGDIDGLRAIAVLGVVLYHAFPTLIIGGFTGVDVFFVISGYLISANIYKSAEAGRFSIVDFYRRRIRRIFPSLVLVMVACLGFGWFALFPNEYAQLGKQTALGTGFVSNIGFFRESGYFDVSSITKPLLHLWSLGVEEQFYIAWPFIVLLLWRFGRFFPMAALAIAVVSLFASLAVIHTNQPAAFYLPQYRFWELAAGAILAYAARNGWRAPTITAWLGVFVVAVSYAFSPDGPSFPGYWAILPVFGACLVILSTPEGWINQKVLGNRVARFIGLVSFPFYLWHWPLLSFANIVLGAELSWRIRVVAVAAAFALACLTYFFIERPLRFSKSRYVTVGLVIAITCTGLFGWLSFSNGGFLKRDTVVKQDEINSLLVGTTWKYTKNDLCVSLYASTFRYFCSQEKTAPPTVMLMGNSYANHLYGGLVENPRFNKQNILSYGSCQPDGVQTDCFTYEKIIEENPSIRYVIFSSLWPRLDQNGLPVDMITGEPVEDNGQSRYEEFLNKKIDFLEKHGITIILFKPKPEVIYEPRTCFSRPFAPASNECMVSVKDADDQQRGIIRIIDKVVARHPKVYVFEQNPLFCDEDSCSLIKDGLPLLRDFRHYSEFGSRLIIERFADWAKQHNIGIVD
jgi:peptidoglycan/LPS O-acetylase OafA/YrhL